MSTALIEPEVEHNGQTIGNAIATTRQAQEVQAAMIIAKRFPRDEDAAAAKILKACCRNRLAEAACYEYTKGGSKIAGPSIRLAEVMAQNWGNMDFGFVELERVRGRGGVGESIVQAQAWDLETNTRRSATFNVRHWRDTKSGGYPLEDEREIYELIANQAARRVRACILAVIPGDIQDAAVEQCEKTLVGQSTEPLTDRVRKMIAAFDTLGVTKAEIESKLGHATSAITHAELARMTKIFTSIRDGFGTREEHFKRDESTPKQPQKKLDELTEKLMPFDQDQPEPPRDNWTQFNDAMSAAKTLADWQHACDYWSKQDFGAARNTEAIAIMNAAKQRIHEAKGARKQKELA